MAKKTFRCRVVTPAASLVDDQVTYASIPAWDGLMGVLPGRAPILARLGQGELRLEFPDTDKGPGGHRSFVLGGGFLRMDGHDLTILAERASPVEGLTESEIEAELKAIETRKIPDSPAERRTALDRQAQDRALAKRKLQALRARRGV